LNTNLKQKLSNFKNLGFFTGKIPPISSRIRQLKKVRKIQAKKLKAKKNDKKRKINKIIDEIDKQKLDNTLNLIIKLLKSSKKINLISSI